MGLLLFIMLAVAAAKQLPQTPRTPCLAKCRQQCQGRLICAQQCPAACRAFAEDKARFRLNKDKKSGESFLGHGRHCEGKGKREKGKKSRRFSSLLPFVDIGSMHYSLLH